MVRVRIRLNEKGGDSDYREINMKVMMAGDGEHGISTSQLKSTMSQDTLSLLEDNLKKI